LTSSSVCEVSDILYCKQAVLFWWYFDVVCG